jgi:drug/metabolite transporter (DMT)-like permease
VPFEHNILTSRTAVTPQKTATIFALIAVLCWSTVASAFKLSLQHVTPPQLILIAATTSWAFLLGMLVIQGRVGHITQLSTKQCGVSFLFGLLNPTLYYLLLFYAYDMLPAQEAQAINYSWAIVMSLLAVPLLGQVLGKSDIFAAVVCYLGVLVIATRGDLLGLEFANIKGVALAVISTLVWSIYWIYNRRDEREEILGLFLNFSFALPLIFIYCWFSGELNGLASGLVWQGLVGGIYVGLVEMGLGFVFWLYAMKRADNTAKIANLIFISPFLSLWLIVIFLGETILPSTLVGLALIILGLVIQSFGGIKKDA